MDKKKQHLISLATSNKNKTYQKVYEALNKLKKKGKPFSKKDVIEQANISRKTLYNRKDIMNMVEESINIMKDNKGYSNKQASIQNKRIDALRKENKELKEEKKYLLEECMNLKEDIIILKREIKDFEEYIQDKKIHKIAKIHE